MTTKARSARVQPRPGEPEFREAQAAARAKVTIDRRRGRETEEWIRRLAEGKEPFPKT